MRERLNTWSLLPVTVAQREREKKTTESANRTTKGFWVFKSSSVCATLLPKKNLLLPTWDMKRKDWQSEFPNLNCVNCSENLIEVLWECSVQEAAIRIGYWFWDSRGWNFKTILFLLWKVNSRTMISSAKKTIRHLNYKNKLIIFKIIHILSEYLHVYLHLQHVASKRKNIEITFFFVFKWSRL